MSPVSQEEAKAEAVGKQVAGTLVERPRPSPSTFRSPCGPSVMQMEGICNRSTRWVRHQPSPDNNNAFSSRVICATSAVALRT